MADFALEASLTLRDELSQPLQEVGTQVQTVNTGLTQAGAQTAEAGRKFDIMGMSAREAGHALSRAGLGLAAGLEAVRLAADGAGEPLQKAEGAMRALGFALMAIPGPTQIVGVGFEAVGTALGVLTGLTAKTTQAQKELTDALVKVGQAGSEAGVKLLTPLINEQAIKLGDAMQRVADIQNVINTGRGYSKGLTEAELAQAKEHAATIEKTLHDLMDEQTAMKANVDFEKAQADAAKDAAKATKEQADEAKRAADELDRLRKVYEAEAKATVDEAQAFLNAQKEALRQRQENAAWAAREDAERTKRESDWIAQRARDAQLEQEGIRQVAEAQRRADEAREASYARAYAEATRLAEEQERQIQTLQREKALREMESAQRAAAQQAATAQALSAMNMWAISVQAGGAYPTTATVNQVAELLSSAGLNPESIGGLAGWMAKARYDASRSSLAGTSASLTININAPVTGVDQLRETILKAVRDAGLAGGFNKVLVTEGTGTNVPDI